MGLIAQTAYSNSSGLGTTTILNSPLLNIFFICLRIVLSLTPNFDFMAAGLAVVAIYTWKALDRDRIRAWLRETWWFVRTIFPLLLASCQMPPAAKDMIVFVSERDGDLEIYLMDIHGHEQARLTDSAGFDNNPSCSPDSTKIAFHSSRNGKFEIYVMDADGSNQTRLTNNPAIKESPSWLPKLSTRP